MKTLWKVVGIAVAVAILGLAAVGAVAYAQDEGNETPFDFAGRFKEALADALGVSVEQYDAAVETAQSQVVDEAVAEGWLTEEQAELYQWQMDQAPGGGVPGMGRGFGGHGPGMGRMGDDLLSIAADELGIKLTDLLTELQGGKSLADVAADKGVDTQIIVDAYLDKIQEKLDQAVADGRITQKQADHQLEQAEQRVTDQLDNTWEEGMPGGGGPRGGMMGLPPAGGL